MDIIYECANNFKKLENTKYHFVFVQNRKNMISLLTFALQTLDMQLAFIT